MLSARSRKAPTYGVTYVSLEDCTLHFETEYIIERRDGSLAHMPMRTPVSEREAALRDRVHHRAPRRQPRAHADAHAGQ